MKTDNPQRVLYFCIKSIFLNRLLYFLLLFFIVLTMCGKKAYAQSDKEKSQKLFIKNIVFYGNKITKDKIIAREMSIQSGDSINTDELESLLEFNKRRILNLQLFSRVEYCIDRWDSSGIEIEYTVTEILYWLPSPIFSLADRNINVWWVEENHRLDRTNIGLELTRLNFRGRNERINAIVQVGYNKVFNLGYRIPYIDKGLKHGLNFGVSYSTGREINFMTDSNKILFYSNEQYPYQKFQARFGTTFRKKYVAIHELQLSYNFFSITQSLFDRNPDFLGGKKRVNYFELMYNYEYNNTDVRVYPTNGMDFRINISKKGLGIDKDINQFMIYNETSYYKKLSNAFSTSFVFRGRLSFDDKQPYITNRALGYKNEYVRGYEYFVIDGSHYAILRSNLRYKLLDKLISQNIVKFIKYIPVRLYAKVFDDVGYVKNQFPGNSFLNNRFLNGYGAGLDIVISYYAKFRIEYSFNHLMQNGLFLHGSKE